MLVDGFPEGQETAVLCSGGLDSAVLVAHEARRGPVQPLYVKVGLAWEAAELRWLLRLLEHGTFSERVRPAVCLTFDMRDVYAASHWAVRGAPPARDTADEEVYIEGRNLVLLTKAAVFCAGRGITRLALGPLAGNPFPDATPGFFAALARALSLGLDRPMELAAPFARLHKADVIRLGLELRVPLELTVSCMNPQGERHCGRCSKCRERGDAFAGAGVDDPTAYAEAAPSGAAR